MLEKIHSFLCAPAVAWINLMSIFCGFGSKLEWKYMEEEDDE